MYRSPRGLGILSPRKRLSSCPSQKMTSYQGWRAYGGSRATKKETGKVSIEFLKWASPLLTISVILVTQSRLEGRLQQELKVLKEELKADFSRIERRSDSLEKRIHTFDVKFDGKLSDLSRQLEREVSFLQGYKSADESS